MMLWLTTLAMLNFAELLCPLSIVCLLFFVAYFFFDSLRETGPYIPHEDSAIYIFIILFSVVFGSLIAVNLLASLLGQA